MTKGEMEMGKAPLREGHRLAVLSTLRDGALSFRRVSDRAWVMWDEEGAPYTRLTAVEEVLRHERLGRTMARRAITSARHRGLVMSTLAQRPTDTGRRRRPMRLYFLTELGRTELLRHERATAPPPGVLVQVVGTVRVR